MLQQDSTVQATALQAADIARVVAIIATAAVFTSSTDSNVAAHTHATKKITLTQPIAQQIQFAAQAVV